MKVRNGSCSATISFGDIVGNNNNVTQSVGGIICGTPIDENLEREKIESNHENIIVGARKAREIKHGGRGNDRLIAHKKINSNLYGGAGDDWLIAGRKGKDHLWGGAGIDAFELKKGRGMATIMDHEWKDWIYIKAPARSISYDTRFGDMQIYQGNDLLAEVGGAGNKDLWHDGGKYWYIE